MSQGTVSVVIPAHNAALFLAEAVASVRAQTRPADEIIIVDDGSTDGTPEVIATLGEGVRAVRQPQAGAGAARNHGAERAVGEWLTFLDADDLWAPEKLAGQLAGMARPPATDVVFGHGCNFSTEPDGTRRLEPGRPAFLPGAALMRRSFFLQRARFREAREVSEVVEWNLRLRREGARIGVLPELILYRRLHAANSRKAGDGGRRQDLRLVRDWVRQRRGE